MHRSLLSSALLVALLLTGGCGMFSGSSDDETVGWSAQRLYGEAKDAQAGKDWPKAIKYLEKLEARYPYGRFAQQAQLEVAYCQWKDEERAAAIASADRFIKLYPNHPNVDYAWYLKGLINFGLQQTILTTWTTPDLTDRDPKASREAFDAFKEVVTRYPQSKYAEDAEARMRYLVNALASHEVHVARYYMKRGAYIAAANRAQYAIRYYPTAPALEEAVYVLVKAYDALGMDELRNGADRVMRANFPDSRYLKAGGDKREAPWWRLWDPDWVSRTLVIGAAGMIGRKLVQRLLKEGITDLILHDVVTPSGFKAKTVTSDLSLPGEAEKLVADRPDPIYHLAAIVSGEAEADFEKGYRINLDGTRRLFEAVRKEGSGAAGPYRPRIVFTSSIAVFGAPFPDAIGDEFLNAPLTSYGTQKAIGELLLSDYSRRGFFDGIGIRLPTICVRPGKPNKAASGFFSGILREPLAGQEAVLPVPDTVRHWFASPRAAIEFLIRASKIDTALLGTRRNLSMPGLSATIAEEIESLRRVGGEKAVRLIRREPDPTIQRIVEGWPRNFDAKRSLALGFRPDPSFDDIVRFHVEDELS